MSDYQKSPIQDPSTNIQCGTGSVGVFVCDSSNPFDASTLTGKNEGKVGFAVQFKTRNGSSVSVASATLNGVIGNSSFLTGAWNHNDAFAVEIETLAMTTGFALIYLKQTQVNP